MDNDMSKVNKIMAGAGIAGTIVYAIADMFLYIGQDVLSDDQTALWNVPEWRLMTSMWIGVIGSLLLLMGFISLGKMYHNVFRGLGNILILPSLLCIGGVLYMHFTLGVYSPLTYRSAINAGVSESQIVTLIEHAQSYLNPLTYTLAILGYLTEIILIYGILSGKFGLKKRNVFYIFGGYFILVLIFVVFAKITGEWGVTGSLESVLEMTFFIPAYLYWRIERVK
ncbi:MAG: hypothetical protein IJ619_01910 [Eubacterium sp.]|nr:hypothetical protein [Eubacterium sp.]